jgi:hypothetical protein
MPNKCLCRRQVTDEPCKAIGGCEDDQDRPSGGLFEKRVADTE